MSDRSSDILPPKTFFTSRTPGYPAVPKQQPPQTTPTTPSPQPPIQEPVQAQPQNSPPVFQPLTDFTPPPPPWAKVKQEKSVELNQSDPVTRSPDQDKSDLAGDIPAHGQIISMNGPHHFHIPIVLITIILILLAPFAALTWASYQNWPSYLKIPPIIAHTTDSLIARTPLPLTPAQLFRIVLVNVSQKPTITHQLLITSTQLASGNQVSLTVSGKSAKDGLGEWQIAGRYQIDDQTIPLNALMAKDLENLYFKVSQTTPLPQADFSSINNEWIHTPLSTDSEDAVRITPGQQALTKIRDTKLKVIYDDFFTRLQDNSRLINDERVAPPSHHLIQTSVSSDQIIEFLRAIIAVYQETQTFHNFEDYQMEQWYAQIEQYIAEPILISTLINKKNLMPEIINITTKLDPEYATQSEAALANFDRQSRIYTTEINYTPNFSDEKLSVELPTNHENYYNVDWRGSITYPILAPIMDYLANSSINNM